MQKESEIQSQILAWLKVSGYLAVRVPLSGKLISGAGGKKFMVGNQMSGFPDILGWWPNGRSFAIEVKTKVGRLSPKQIDWRLNLEATGVFYVLARSLEDVIEAFKVR